MSADSHPDQIFNNPRFQHLVKSKRRMSGLLSLLVFVVYSVFTLLMAYAPDTMTTKISSDSQVTSGVLYALLSIVLMVVVSSVYTRWANTHFDRMKQELLNDIAYIPDTE